MRRAALVLLGLAGAAWPCSIEIWSIADDATRSANIVTGQVLAVHDTLLADPDDPERTARVWLSATLRVDRVLKGSVPTDTIQLGFHQVDLPTLFYVACWFGYPYEAGDHKLLMLGEPEDGVYYAPRYEPQVIALPSGDPAGSALLEYVSYISRHGRRPVELRFEGPDAVAPGRPQDLRISVTNHMSIPITLVATPGSYVTPPDNGALVVLPLENIGVGGVAPRPVHPDTAAFVTARGGESGAVSLRLSDYYDLRPGRYGLLGNIFLATAPDVRVTATDGDRVFRDRWYNFGPEFAFSVTEGSTAVQAASWGRVKAASCACAGAPRGRPAAASSGRARPYSPSQ